MRVYKDKKLTKVVCNNCGKNIKVNNSTIEEGVFFADYKWGYFSKKMEEKILLICAKNAMMK